jgi:hypothetical protein
MPVVKKRHVVNALKYVVGLGLLGWVVWRYWAPPPGKGPGLSEALEQPLRFLPFAAAVLVCVVGVLLTFVRWYILVRAQDLPLTPVGALRLGLIGYFFNIFLPGSVGGDLVKAAGLAAGQRRRTVAVATVLIDRAIGVLGLVWVVALLGGAFWLGGNPVLLGQKYLQSLVLTSAGIAGGSVLLWLLLGILPPHRADRFAGRLERIPKLGGVAAEFWRAVWMYRTRGRWVAGALAVGVAAHFALVLMFYLAAHTVQLPGVTLPTLTEHFLVIPVGLIVEGVFPTPGGVGGGEAFFGWLYELLGRPGAAGAFGALAKRVITWIVGAISILVYLSMKPELVEATEVAPAAVEPEASGATA